MQFLRRKFGRWARAYRKLPMPKTDAPPPIDEAAVRAALEASPIPIRPVTIDPNAWREWCLRADYGGRYPDYYTSNIAEKSLEHFLVASELDLKPADVYIDIASQNGVAGEIYERLYKCKSYRQDLDFPAGLHDRIIGGDAGALPLPDDFADAMGLHCSLEHFEGRADTRFINECARVLKPGGRCVSAPLYLFQYFACVTNPLESAGRVSFDNGATLHALRGWGNRHGRFYDVPHLLERIWEERDNLEMEVLAIENFRDVDPGCYLRYALVIRKPGPKNP